VDQQFDIKNLVGANSSYYTKTTSQLHSFYINTIEPAENYTEWFEAIRNAPEQDIVKLHINSYGGDLFCALQWMRVLNECQAVRLMSVEGACMSAATLLFLQGDAFEVSDHSMFMFHNYSGGVIGKGGEMIDQLQHERDWSEKLMRDSYKDFLTDREITSMLNNKDIWMDGDQVVKRLEKKAKKVNNGRTK